MRLKTIWTLSAMSMTERVRRTVDWAAFITATKLPKRVIYWAVMITIGKATATGPYANHVMSTRLEDILEGIEGGPK